MVEFLTWFQEPGSPHSTVFMSYSYILMVEICTIYSALYHEDLLENT